MNYEGEKFLLKLYKDLYNKDEVKFADFRSGKNSGTKYELIRKYLERLERQEKVFDGEHENLENFLKEKYYEAYVIREEDIPDSYWKHQEEVALERGHGHIEYTDDLKHREAQIIIKDQQTSLEKWINYLMKENTSYPMWIRYWAFQGMLKLGEYDKETRTYKTRTKKTVGPFAELDAEALAKTIEVVVNLVEGKELNDEELEKLIDTGSFEKIYSYHIVKLNEIRNANLNRSDKEEGIWIKYKKGDEQKVVQSLDGKGTGWCIAGIGMAKSYLEYGTLNIYYTMDENNNYTVPRACIRTTYDSIAEVRGIEKDQNMEGSMLDVVNKKLDEYPDKEEYKKKVRDMKKLTEIYNKRIKKDEELTTDELRFLYELDGKIKGFGWSRDPRINEIKETVIINDKKFAMEVLKKGDNVLKYASPKLTKDKDIVIAAVHNNGNDLKYANRRLNNNKQIVLVAVRNRGGALEYASDKLKKDKEVVLAAVKNYGQALEYASDKLKKDKEVVLAAVKNYGQALEYASEELKNDKEVVLAAVKNHCWSLEYGSEELKNDKEVVLTAVRNDGLTLQFVGRKLKNDKEFMMTAVKECSFALMYASKEIKNNKEVVLAAVKNYGGALEYASEELKNDREIVLTAVKNISTAALAYASEELKNDREMILTAVQNYGLALKYASEELKNDREVVLAAVKKYGEALKYASEKLKNDKEIVLAAVRSHGLALEYASEELKNDREVVLAAIENNCSTLAYASKEIKKDKKIMLISNIKIAGFLGYTGKRIKLNREKKPEDSNINNNDQTMRL